MPYEAVPVEGVACEGVALVSMACEGVTFEGVACEGGAFVGMTYEGVTFVVEYVVAVVVSSSLLHRQSLEFSFSSVTYVLALVLLLVLIGWSVMVASIPVVFAADSLFTTLMDSRKPCESNNSPST